MRTFLNTSKSSILFCVALICLLEIGCAESDFATTNKNEEHADVGPTGDADNPDPEDADPADTAEDTDAGPHPGVDKISYEPCVIDGSAPWEDVAWGDCQTASTLDFGDVGTGQVVTRLVRIDNTGEVNLQVKESILDDPNFSVQALRYSEDTPAVGTDHTLPAGLLAGQSFFFEVTATGPGVTAPFAADVFEILLEPDSTGEVETLSIPLVGAFESCAPHTLDCDGDPSNGCEVDTRSDALNCGGCGIVCAAENGQTACVEGVCVVDSCAPNRASCDDDVSTGCETDLRTLGDCGACGNVCAFDNGAAQCGSGSCIFQGCDPGFANCDRDLSNGCEVDTNSNMEHCGGCRIACAFPNASATCDAGSCEILECDAGSVDLNNDPSDGCECTITDANDMPDANGIDSNCDGIDGDVSRGIFVATGGSDAAAGTRAAPLKTITKALSMATSLSGLDHIYVATGQYNEQVTLANGISIFGGYDADDNWSRNGGATSKIFYDGPGERIAVRGIDITSETYLGMVEVATANTTVAGQSNYALHCKNCGGLVIQNSKLIAGNAGAGKDGANGTSGSAGSNGGIGGNGDGDGPNWGAGGRAGDSSCGRTGGAGGRGGLRGENPGMPGKTGVSGSTGGRGGAGDYGFWGALGESGKPGSTGATPSDGQNGSGGNSGTVIGDVWQGKGGADGTDGEHGNGGGGGGGGGGQEVGNSSWNGAGNGGGGGGGGGCRGTAGSGGGAGGSSFGLFLVNSTGITLTDNAIKASDGGNGGKGGKGGAGGAGGNGRRGGNADLSDVGAGGHGGNGSKGGTGGHGGGGAGGNSYGVYRQSTTISPALPAGNTITKGNPGTGGTSSGNAGSNGVAESY